MPFVEANALYETWLRGQCAVVACDLKAKHEKMAKSPFAFLRCTFFRWAATIEHICPALAGTLPVRSVGDLHVENFGTWRDVEGRLVWGVNDFDEAATIPFAYDLVRLATSARLAPDQHVGHREAADAILEGYRRGLRDPRPIVLDEQETWMRPFVACTDEARKKFWCQVDHYPDADLPIPDHVERGLQQSLPAHTTIQRFATRRRGGGSLGRPRYVAIAAWRGGRVVREAKALVPSAWLWAHGSARSPNSFIAMSHAVYRSPDPFLVAQDDLVVRRIAADSRKVEFGPDTPLVLRRSLLEVMGFDTASIHRATGAADRIEHALTTLGADWLHRASKAAEAAVRDDYKAWKAQRPRD